VKIRQIKIVIHIELAELCSEELKGMHVCIGKEGGEIVIIVALRRVLFALDFTVE